MPPLDFFHWRLLASAIEFFGALVITGAALLAFWSMRPGRQPPWDLVVDPGRTRAILARGAIAGLDFKLAATLLKTIELRSWNQILVFAAIYAIRVVIKFQLRRELTLSFRDRRAPL